jgi:predicted DNA-binding transcriptional regulator AlpA
VYFWSLSAFLSDAAFMETTQFYGGKMAPEAESVKVLREPAAAKALGVSKAALRRWRREGRGPSFIRLQRAIGYRVSDLEKFLSENTVRARSDRG